MYSSATTSNPQQQQQQQHVPLAIEATAHDSQNDREDSQTMDLGEGNVIKLDRLGPMIINSDGTLSRIQNWQELHPIEQERTVRLLVKKRNLVRLKTLNEKDKTQGERTGAEESGAPKNEVDKKEV
ncbi:uncharacterized protein L203_104043 [Cryptococcus depauperatus CBS 7841]|uniref:Uncharacterized protein n=1 Tax=Cryptococcus depauperatus CBS 7841 TaxID=1295531 RepID=A0A1E3IC05_9TREE|nr:hypothetical protein L203_04508 [Cryptococcus depauperatus CBS 7841]